MHIPVLKKEVLEYLDPKPNENFIDCTCGGGGHAFAILEMTAPKGKVLGIDWDTDALQKAKSIARNLKFENRIVLVNGNFAYIQEIAAQEKFTPVHGILFDLGLSSEQLEQSKRGFSFQRDEPLDMRYSLTNPFTAEKIVNYWSRYEIERILKEYGEEQFAQSIAKAIVDARSKKPITKTLQLTEIIKQATPKWYHRKKIHPATKTFQALRIAVNDELGNLKKALPQGVELLENGGRIVVISFHSLEDRIIKNFFRDTPNLKVLTKKPITPMRNEIQQNPRSRSAKLRAALKIQLNQIS